jgi:succinate dehydrogenase/fumarate reductase flavoprotein subunit
VLDLATVEATNLHLVSVLLTVAALARTESRGCHRWHAADGIDHFEQSPRHSVLRLGSELAVGARPVRTGPLGSDPLGSDPARSEAGAA